MLKDAVGNTLKKGDWVIDTDIDFPFNICCICLINRWHVTLIRSLGWDFCHEHDIYREQSERLIKITCIKSPKLIEQYLLICSSIYFKLFVSNNKKAYKPLILIDSPLCGS